jgi:hypothetical protein
MKMKYRIHALLFGICLCCFAVTSCDDKEGDDLRSIGRRVEILEDSVLSVNNQILALKEIVATIEGNGFVTQILENPNHTFTITFNNGKTITLRQGKDGKDGKAQDLQEIGVATAEDGKYYWTFNGQWLLDPNGKRMPVTGRDGEAGKDGKDGIDGKDGRNGVDGKDGVDGKNGVDGKDGVNGKDGKDDINMNLIIPQVRINAYTYMWEISTDNGRTWTTTNVLAKGTDGRDGINGRDGIADPVSSVTISSNGRYATFTLTNGVTFTIGIIQ